MFLKRKPISPLGVCALLAVLTFAVMLFADNQADVDLWGNVGFVKSLPWQQGFLTENTFSFTQPERAWINHEWLSEYILHAVHLRFGNAGLMALKVLLGALVLLLMSASMRRAGVSGPVHTVLLLLILSTMGYGFSTRPHLFTYVMLAILLTILECCPGRKRIVWPAFAAMGVVWANLHGAFFIGLVVMLLFVGLQCYAARRSGSCRSHPDVTLPVGAILFVAASFVNPYGWRLWSFIGESGGHLRPYLSEWAPFHPLTHFADHVDFMALAALAMIAMWAHRAAAGPVRVGIFAITLLSALLLRRHIPIFALVCAFTAAPAIDRLLAPHLRSVLAKMRPALPMAVLLVLMAGSVCRTIRRSDWHPLAIEVSTQRFPTDIVALMQANEVQGNLLAFFDWAEMCIWKLPACPVFLDGRFRSAYDTEVIEDFFAFVYCGPDWERALSAYPTDLVLIHVGNPVYPAMGSQRDWALIVETDLAGLFARRRTMQPLITRAARGQLVQPAMPPRSTFP